MSRLPFALIIFLGLGVAWFVVRFLRRQVEKLRQGPDERPPLTADDRSVQMELKRLVREAEQRGNLNPAAPRARPAKSARPTPEPPLEPAALPVPEPTPTLAARPVAPGPLPETAPAPALAVAPMLPAVEPPAAPGVPAIEGAPHPLAADLPKPVEPVERIAAAPENGPPPKARPATPPPRPRPAVAPPMELIRHQALKKVAAPRPGRKRKLNARVMARVVVLSELWRAPVALRDRAPWERD